MRYPFERFTERAKRVLTLAQEEAERSGQSYIGTEHLLLGLLRESQGLAAKVLNNLGVEIGAVREAIESVFGGNKPIMVQQIIPTSRVKKVIQISFEEAGQMSHNYVGTEHLLLGLLIEDEGIAAHVLKDLGISLEATRREIERLLVSSGEGEQTQRRPIYRVGDRVLVHDPDPPYRLWEGRVVKVEGEQPEIAVPGRAAGESVTADVRRVHPVPLGWAGDCPFCQSG
jgi:ATP-dependent Clp protease ATP-binding subunit ClpA